MVILLPFVHVSMSANSLLFWLSSGSRSWQHCYANLLCISLIKYVDWKSRNVFRS